MFSKQTYQEIESRLKSPNSTCCGYFLTLLFSHLMIIEDYEEFDKYISKSRTNTTLTSTQKSDTKYIICTATWTSRTALPYGYISEFNKEINAVTLDTKISKVSSAIHINIFVKGYLNKQNFDIFSI